MSAQFSTKVENMLGSLERTIELFVEYGGEDSCNINTFTHMAKEICDLEMANTKAVKALEQSKDQETVAAFENTYSRAQSAPGPKTSKRYAAFTSSAKQHLGKSRASTSHEQGTIHGDDVEFDDFFSEIDPITKKPMVHPVKNKKCGHYYEKSSIMESIRINRNLRCPVVGCGNKNPILPAHLMDDPAFAKRLKERQVQEDSD